MVLVCFVCACVCMCVCACVHVCVYLKILSSPCLDQRLAWIGLDRTPPHSRSSPHATYTIYDITIATISYLECYFWGCEQSSVSNYSITSRNRNVCYSNHSATTNPQTNTVSPCGSSFSASVKLLSRFKLFWNGNSRHNCLFTTALL